MAHNEWLLGVETEAPLQYMRRIVRAGGGHSSVVRALAVQARGSRFDSQQLVAFHFLLHCLKPTTCLQSSSSILKEDQSSKGQLMHVYCMHSSRAIGLHKDIICLGTVMASTTFNIMQLTTIYQILTLITKVTHPQYTISP